MKLSYLLPVLSVSILVGCSHVNDSKRDPAGVNDVGVAKGTERLLFYKEGEFIMVRSCPPNTLFGTTIAEARKNCVGKTNDVPLQTFRNEVKLLMFDPNNRSLIKPITPEDLDASVVRTLTPKEITDLTKELDVIKQNDRTNGKNPTNDKRRSEIEKLLAGEAKRKDAVRKIENQIDNLINRIAQPNVNIARQDQDSDKLIYTVLSRFNPTKNFPCGLQGSIEERIKDCSYKDHATLGHYVLVTTTKSFRNIYKDNRSNLLWARYFGRDNTSYTVDDAKGNCKSINWDTPNYYYFGSPKADWRVPTTDEFDESVVNGIHKTGMLYSVENKNLFWTSTKAYDGADDVYLFHNAKNTSREYVYSHRYGINPPRNHNLSEEALTEFEVMRYSLWRQQLNVCVGSLK